jgi:hypothetical protein
MDSDDISREDRFETQLSCFEADPDLVVCGSNVSEFLVSPDSPTSDRRLPKNLNKITKFSRYRNPLNHPSVMFKRSCIMDVGGYMDMPYFEDYYLWVRCIMAGFVITNIQENLVFMRGGKPQLLRRSGFEYAKREWIFLNKLYRIGFIKLHHLVPILLIKFSIRLAPLFFVKRIYSMLRRL